MENEHVKGEIAAISDKEGRWGIRIADDWYNGFGTIPNIQKGDLVDVEYTQKGTFKDVVKLVPTTQPETKPLNVPQLRGMELMGECYDAIEKIIGHKPSDHEVSMVSSLFIYNTRR